MVHSRSAIIFLTTAFCLVDSALGTAPTIKVLTGSIANACTPQKVDILKERLAEAITLAEDASKTLKVKGVETSDAFKSFLGDAKPAEVDAQHYAPVASLRSVVLESVTSDEGHAPNSKTQAPDTQTLFMCLRAQSPKCNRAGQHWVAQTYPNQRAVGFCPMFFEKTVVQDPSGPRTLEPFSLAAGEAKFLATKNTKGGDSNWVIPASDLLHEFQHVPSVVGHFLVKDLFVKPDAPHTVVPPSESGAIGVYGIEACQKLPADQKRLNAQNLAFFAMDVHADPKQGLPQAADADKTGKKSRKRFDAIYQRGVEQKAAAEKQGTEDTTPKPATGNGAATDKAKKPSTEQTYVSKYKRPEFGPVPSISDIEGQE